MPLLIYYKTYQPKLVASTPAASPAGRQSVTVLMVGSAISNILLCVQFRTDRAHLCSACGEGNTVNALYALAEE